MLTRYGFVTNSSSTAFIAFGMKLPSGYAIGDGEDITDADGDSVDWEDYYEECGGENWPNPTVEFAVNERDEAVMYATKSYRNIADDSYTPLGKIVEDPRWIKDLKAVCSLVGMNYTEPEWFGWFEQ